MKPHLIFAGLIMAMALATTPVLSQPGKDCKHHLQGEVDSKAPNCFLPGLTQEQTKQIEQLKLKHMKDVLQMHNSLKEKQARLRTLETAEKADLTAINKIIDEITVIKSDIMKKRAAHHQEVRKLLTEEQRIKFDTRPLKHRQNGMHGCGGCSNK
jgi:Spy/CpxP family protein refolding chaperone